MQLDRRCAAAGAGELVMPDDTTGLYRPGDYAALCGNPSAAQGMVSKFQRCTELRGTPVCVPLRYVRPKSSHEWSIDFEYISADRRLRISVRLREQLPGGT